MFLTFAIGIMTYSLPMGVSLESLENLILGWYLAGAAEEACSNKEAARKLGVDHSQISRNNKFLISIGVLAKEGRGKKLTVMGEEYAEAVRREEENPAGTIHEELRGFDLTEDTVDYVKIQSPSQEELIQRVEELSEQVENRSASPNTFISLLFDSGILFEKEGEIEARLKEELKTESESSVDDQPQNSDDERDFEGEELRQGSHCSVEQRFR